MSWVRFRAVWLAVGFSALCGQADAATAYTYVKCQATTGSNTWFREVWRLAAGEISHMDAKSTLWENLCKRPGYGCEITPDAYIARGMGKSDGAPSTFTFSLSRRTGVMALSWGGEAPSATAQCTKTTAPGEQAPVL